MFPAMSSPICRVSTGYLNTVNDTVPGGTSSGMSGSSVPAKFAGQLGKFLTVSQEQIALLTNTSIGTLYGGVYQYVQFNSSGSTPAPEIGQALFWDNAEDPESFIVTDTDTTTSVCTPAGVYIGGIEDGNYGFIQVAGLCEVLTAHSLAIAPSTGQQLVVAATGLFNNSSDVGAAAQTYSAWAVEIPANFTLIKAQIAFLAFRG